VTTPPQGVRDRLGVWVAGVAAVAGTVLVVLDLVAGKAYLAYVRGLVPGLPLVAVGTTTALAARRRDVDIAVWLAPVVVVAFVVNLVGVWVRVGNEVWPWLIPPAPGWGVDFRDGLYEPARAFSVARSGWPPLTLLLGKAFTVLPFSSAYAVQTVLLTCAAVGCAVLSGQLAVKVAPEPGVRRPGDLAPGRVTVAGLSVVFGAWLVTSYGFMYEVHRGNIDLYALLCCLLAVWAAVRLPRSPWWPAAALAVAVNLKLYPAVLLVLLFWRYRLRALVPVLVTNAVLLLAAGPVNTWRLFTWLTTMSPGSRKSTWAEMGSAGMAAVMRVTDPTLGSWIIVPLFLVPLGLWAASAALLMRRGWTTRRAVLLAASCIPLMGVVPTLSNDYKLVLFVFPLAVIAATLGSMAAPRERVGWCLSLGVLGWLIVMMSRSTAFHGMTLVGSKYSLVVVLQLLLLYVVWRVEGWGVRTADEAAPSGDVRDEMEEVLA
jgi:hypothetical protein